MQPRRLLVVYLLVGLVSYTLLLAYGKDEGEAITEEAITVDQQKVHQECRNPDYKQYLKCLMRPKRHHHTDRGDTSPETGRPSVIRDRDNRRRLLRVGRIMQLPPLHDHLWGERERERERERDRELKSYHTYRT
jgi:hypothetical protein